MDSFLDFTFLLPDNGGPYVPPNEPFSVSSSEPFDVPVDAEQQGGGLTYSMCLIS